MEFEDWEPFYRRIARALDIDENEDLRSQGILSEMLRSNQDIDRPEITRERLRSIIEGSTCLVIGGSISLDRAIPVIKARIDGSSGDLPGEFVLVAADGATSILLKGGLTPDIIVTDLDGGTGDQIDCLSRGTVMVVHAHGDNMDRLNEAGPRFHGSVIGSTQRDPGNDGFLINMGGFTDGDRAAMIVDHLGARSIELYGFDLDDPSPKIEDGGDRKPLPEAEASRKRIKLEFAREILDTVDRNRLRMVRI